MSEKVATGWKKYGISLAATVVMVVAYALGENIAKQELVNAIVLLSDAFAVPGFLFLFAGIIVWLANNGSFDAVGYLATAVVRFFIPGGNLQHESYGDYKERKNGKKTTGYGFLFVVGLACMAIAVIFLCIYLYLHGPI